ncbi:MAG: hypothetical protein ACRDF0_05775 [Candidatus Limnocylindria bacterium]
MILLGAIALVTLAANGATRLRSAAVAFFFVALVANVIAASVTSPAQLAIAGCAGLVAAALLYVAARDDEYGEDPGWRLWLATVVAAAATSAAFTAFRTAVGEGAALPLFGPDASGLTVQVSAFWLLSSGVAVLLTAAGATRMTLGALLMITGVQLLVRIAPGPQLASTLLLSWLEVVLALAGAFLIVNQRAVRA